LAREAWLPLLVLVAAAGSAGAQTRATIYTDGRVFVRRTIERPIPRGTTIVPLPLEGALAGSVIALDTGVTIVEVRVPMRADLTGLLRRAVGRRVMLRGTSPSDTTSALVLAADPPRYQLADGTVTASVPGTIAFPEDLAGPSRLARITVESREPRSRIAVGYLINGAWWQGHYILTLDGRAARLSAAALVVSETVALDSAEIFLLEGRVSRVSMQLSNAPGDDRPRLLQNVMQGPGGVAGQGAGGGPSPDTVRVYRLPGRHSVHPTEVASIPLLPESPVQVTRVLSVPGVLPGGSLPVQGLFGREAAPVGATVRYRIERAGGAGFGGALPGGSARIYRSVGGSGMALAAEATVSGTDRGGPLYFEAGVSTELAATRIALLATQEIDTTVSATGSRTVRTVAMVIDHTVRLQNRTDSTLVVEIPEQRDGAWTVVSSSVPAQPVAPGMVRFQVTLRPRAETLFTARMRVPVP
jgi:hypothetical protein